MVGWEIVWYQIAGFKVREACNHGIELEGQRHVVRTVKRVFKRVNEEAGMEVE